MLIDLAKLIPHETKEGRKVVSRINGKELIVNYEVKRGRPAPIRLNRFVKKDNFIAGVVVWGCEGSRKKSTNYLEVTNSSESVVKIFIGLLKELGIAHLTKAKVHAPLKYVNRCERRWKKLLGIDLSFGKPIIFRKIRDEESGGILHIRIYSKMLKELFEYWTMQLSQLLQET